jgi:hypothetical protein
VKPQVVVGPDGTGERRETPAPLGHLMAACAFVGLALLWSFPLVLHLNTHLPGPGIGDNVDFLWNFWWARFARANHLQFFRTSFLFAPAGTSLALHTHTALSALAGATVLRGLPLVAAQNVVILVGLFLNGFCAYLLCWRVTLDRASAVVGGVVFGGAPFIAAHLYGHFNFTMAWPIPLFALAVVETTRRWNWRWAALAGFVLGVTLYVDYYYVVFEAAFALCYLTVALWDFSIEQRGPGRLTRILSPVLGILLLLDIILIVVIVRTGGFETVIAGVRVLARDPFNPLQFGWALLAWWYWLQTRPRLRAHRVQCVGAGPVFSVTLTTIFACAVTAAPVLWELGLLMRSGQYVSPPYFWKSAPKGIDLATLFMGNPLNGAFGEVIVGLYRRFGIDVVESTGWLGVAPVVLAIWLVRRTTGRPSGMQAEQSGHGLRSSATVRRWIVVGVVFLVWSLGSHLRVFGINTGMPLPQVFFHYLPIVANARMPGRAIVLVYLALAVLGALALAQRGLWRNPRLYFAAATALLITDFLPAPFPLVALDRPAIYQTLRGRSEQGALCELPFGIRDGSGERGLFDDRILFYQTIHERPLVGGFLARLPPSLIDVYERDPLLAAFLRLSARSLPLDGGDALPDRLQARNRLRTDGIAFLMLNRQTASARLIDYVEHVLPVQRVADEGDRSLYVVEP